MSNKRLISIREDLNQRLAQEPNASRLIEDLLTSHYAKDRDRIEQKLDRVLELLQDQTPIEQSSSNQPVFGWNIENNTPAVDEPQLPSVKEQLQALGFAYDPSVEKWWDPADERYVSYKVIKGEVELV